ncbi:MAG: ribonuclease Y [Nitrospirae bacterium]|nr:MAG: ribonuclease Y [Nitrospirota bacterium]
MDTLIYLILGIVGGVVFASLMLYLNSKKAGKERLDYESEKERILADAHREAERIKKEARLEAKDIIYQAKSETEKEIKERQREINQIERRLRNREENLEKKLDQIEKREHDLAARERDFLKRDRKLKEKESEVELLIKRHLEELEKLSGYSAEKAKEELFRKIEEETRFEAAKMIKQIEEETQNIAEDKAREIISLAIQRYASDYVADSTVTAVPLPNDEMKGRIIGREGRNIRALEAATGVDLIVDDTPEMVTLSSFDPVRREIARISLERLISDGRIHPARIEEVVEKVRKEVERTMREEGEKAVFDLGLSGIPNDIIKLLGRLKYRTSYGQNVLQHSREVAYLAGIMAGELGADVKLAKRAGLLHDIGKAVDHEIEGSHHEIGYDLARKLGENEKVLNAIACHHGDIDPICVESALVAAADALSAARPGVRRESIENYIKRLKKLEEIATAQNGVEKCYAIQAGRELRIIVKPEDITDEMSSLIARDVAKKIQSELTYPGQIKVMVIRESRFVDYAK